MNTPTQNELSKAVALIYDGQQAPQLIAKGQADIAEEILTQAREHNIPICNNPALAELLMVLELGDHIPRELYVAVAHIIAFAYQIHPKQASHKTKDSPLNN